MRQYGGVLANANIYGYDGAAWARILATTPQAGHTPGAGTLPTLALPYLYDDVGFNTYRWTQHQLNADGQGATKYGALVASHLYGFNGGTWDRLQVASSSNPSLRVAPNGEANAVLRTASGDLTTGEISTPVTGLNHYNQALIYLSIGTLTTPDADDEVDFYLQSTVDDGTYWYDIENLHFDQGDNGTTPKLLLVVGPPQSSAVARTRANGSLADNTKLDLPFSDRLRWQVKVTGATAPTYAYHSEASFKAS